MGLMFDTHDLEHLGCKKNQPLNCAQQQAGSQCKPFSTALLCEDPWTQSPCNSLAAAFWASWSFQTVFRESFHNLYLGFEGKCHTCTSENGHYTIEVKQAWSFNLHGWMISWEPKISCFELLEEENRVSVTVTYIFHDLAFPKTFIFIHWMHNMQFVLLSLQWPK